MNKQTNILVGAFKPGIIARIKSTIKIWRDRRSAIRQLNGLPDRLLEDIGISRHEIEQAVRKTKMQAGIPLKKIKDPGITGQTDVYTDFPRVA